MSKLAIAPPPAPPAPVDRLLTLEEKAAHLHISISHLRRLVEVGRVEAVDLTLPDSKRRTLRFKP